MERQNIWATPAQVGEGWQDLVTELEEALTALDPNYTVVQIKEKFGGLRYYFYPSEDATQETRDAMYALVDEAEGKSFKTCEQCSKPGKPGGKSWIVTLCDECRAKR